jgi:hypothetical protein
MWLYPRCELLKLNNKPTKKQNKKAFMKYIPYATCSEWLQHEGENKLLQAWKQDAKKVVALSPAVALRRLSPKKDHSFDWKLLGKNKLLQKVAANSHYVSWERFLKHYKQSLRMFLHEIGNEKFLLYLPGHRGLERSEYWMALLTHILLRQMHRAESGVCSFPMCLFRYPTIRHVLVVNDAIYSGDQMSETMERLQSAEKEFRHFCAVAPSKSYHLVSGFCGQGGLQRVMKAVLPGFAKNLHFYCSEHMKPIASFLSQQEMEAFEKKYAHVSNTDEGLGLYPYVFQHKLADAASSYPEFYSRYMQGCERGHPQCFTPIYKILAKNHKTLL